MNKYSWLAIYGVSIFSMSILGGCLPFVGRRSNKRLPLYLSAASGTMLGAVFFHLIPDAIEVSGDKFGWWMSLGVVGLYCVERIFSRRSHVQEGVDELQVTNSPHDPYPLVAATAGWPTVICLCFHTFMVGVGITDAVDWEIPKAKESNGLMLPGLALLAIAIVLQAAVAFIIATLLRRRGMRAREQVLMQLGVAGLIPLGILAGIANLEMVAQIRNEIAHSGLALSSGVFLVIVARDLLPEIQFCRYGGLPRLLALVLGLVLMGAVTP